MIGEEEEITMEEKTNEVKLIIPLSTYRKIMAYTAICDLEISGFCEVEYNQARHAFIAGEVYLLDQEVTGTGTHMDEEAVSKFNLDYIKKGGTQLPRLWWHSHVNMEAFFSGIDEDTLKELQNDTFAIALVVNKRKEFRAMAYVYKETVTNIMGFEFETKEQVKIDPLHAEVELEYERIPETLKKEVEKKVRERTYHAPTRVPTVYGRDKIHTGEKSIFARALQLPKSPVEANRRILELGLVKEWDNQLQQYVYRDPYTQQIWVDYWKVLSKYTDDDFPND